LADELQLQFDVPGPPDVVLAQWRAEPPRALREADYEIVDESFNSLTFETRYLDWPQKITMVLSLGVALLFKGFMESVFRMTARFDEEGAQTRVTLLGTAHPRTRAALGQLAAEHGGPIGLRVGV
jgi:hypothetical protein